MIEWNRVTWYSKLGAALLFIVVVPSLAFYIGRQYEKTVAIRSSFNDVVPEVVEQTEQKKQKEFSIILQEARADDIRVELSTGKVILIPRDESGYVTDVTVVDINFDNYDDIQLTTQAGAYNMDTEFYVYEQEKGKFLKYDAFALDDLIVGAADFNPDTKTLKTYWKGRGLGDIFVEKTFTYTKGEWHLSETVSQDTIENKLNADSEEQYYLKIVRSISENGKSTERKIYYKGIGDGDSFTYVDVSADDARKATGADL